MERSDNKPIPQSVAPLVSEPVDEKPVEAEHDCAFGPYLFSVAAKKASWAVAKFIASVLSAAVVQNTLTKFGVKIDPQVFMPSVSMGVMAGLELGHDWLRLKTGWKFI